MVTYRLTPKRLENLKNQNNEECKICNLKFNINDIIFTKSSGRNSRSYRHEACARRVGLID